MGLSQAGATHLALTSILLFAPVCDIMRLKHKLTGGEFMPKFNVRRHQVVQPLDNTYRLIPLTQGQNAIVDTADYEWASQFNWRAKWDKGTKSFYAWRHLAEDKASAMHSEIIGRMADHINHDTLDNRRHNLRPANTSQNGRNRSRQSNNTSGYVGVCYLKGKWVARIYIAGKPKHLGTFSTPEAAAKSRDAAVRSEYGEFGVLNSH
jgi:hypothetical protein